MEVRDIMAIGAVTIGPQEKVKDAASLMRMQNVGMLVMTDETEPVGVVTDRDLLVDCVGAGHDPASCRVSRHVSDRVISTDIATDAIDAAREMRTNRIRRMPVTDEGLVVGVVSFSDIARSLDVALRDVLVGMSSPLHASEVTKVGEVTHYYSHLGVAGVIVDRAIRVGDRIYISGRTTNIEQVVESMERDHEPIEVAGRGDDIGIKVVSRVRPGDVVYVASAVTGNSTGAPGKYATVG